MTLNLIGQEITDVRFHDDLLDRLVGKWNVTGIVHGRPSKSRIEAEWVLNHQFLRVHQLSEENVPEINAPFEGIYFIGYDHTNKCYLAHFVCVWGGDDPTEGVLHGSRTGEKIKLSHRAVGNTTINQRFIWEPAIKSWRMTSCMETGGKEDEPFLDVKLTAADARQDQTRK